MDLYDEEVLCEKYKNCDCCIMCVRWFYIDPMREKAIEHIKEKYESSLKVLQEEFSLPDLTNDTYEKYYLATRNYMNNDRIPFTIQNELLAFFDIYEDYYSFNDLDKFE